MDTCGLYVQCTVSHELTTVTHGLTLAPPPSPLLSFNALSRTYRYFFIKRDLDIDVRSCQQA